MPLSVMKSILNAIGFSNEVRNQLRAERMEELVQRKMAANATFRRAYSIKREADETTAAIRRARHGN